MLLNPQELLGVGLHIPAERLKISRWELVFLEAEIEAKLVLFDGSLKSYHKSI